MKGRTLFFYEKPVSLTREEEKSLVEMETLLEKEGKGGSPSIGGGGASYRFTRCLPSSQPLQWFMKKWEFSLQNRRKALSAGRATTHFAQLVKESRSHPPYRETGLRAPIGKRGLTENRLVLDAS